MIEYPEFELQLFVFHGKKYWNVRDSTSRKIAGAVYWDYDCNQYVFEPATKSTFATAGLKKIAAFMIMIKKEDSK